MRPKTQELKEAQGTFEPSKEFESVELMTWDGQRMPAAEKEWPYSVQEVWNNRCKELRDAGYLMKASLPHLKRYCFAVLMVMKAEEALLSSGGGFVVQEEGSQGNTYDVVSKWMTVWEKGVKTMDTIGGKFGFTPLDAMKIPKIKKIEDSGDNLID